METKPSIVVSDIHLGGHSETERRFRQFLRHVEDHAAELYINGDLFDFWFEYRSVIHSEHYRVLAALADVVDRGVPVSFVGGNHDAWGGSFLRDRVGITLLDDASVRQIAGYRCLLVHGDGRGEGDLGYRALKKVIRHPLSIFAFRALHPDWGWRLAQRVTSTQEKRGNPGGANRARAEELERWGRSGLEQDPALDIILAGHTHMPTINEEFPGRYYINTGDWINHYTYLELHPDRAPVLQTWE